MCCRWTHLRRPQTTVQLFHAHTLPLSVSISSLVPSPSSFSNSIIPPLFFRSHFYAFGNQPPSTGFTLFFLKPVFIPKQPCSKRLLIRLWGFKGREQADPEEEEEEEEEGWMGRYNLRGHVLLYKKPWGPRVKTSSLSCHSIWVQCFFAQKWKN